ncbi:MAG: putative zinc-finger [Gaiellaceae bacterium]|jgi:anti-sigma factor (TIGR02949 family)|nr:putative zinc-finger [Gaiellaceae bacterium]MDX6516076.1 putative zinc-finger [Gaiellaceae bacterium]
MKEPCAECDKCEELLQPFLDRDLTESERAEAATHLADCRYCSTRYRFEESLRRYVRQAVAEPCPEGLKQRLAELARQS